MNKQEVLEKIKAVGVLPVIRAPSTDLALRAVEAVLEGGITVLEVTLTVPDALTLIHSLAIRFEDRVVLGAGSVTTTEQALRASEAGAKFIVSPGLNLDMVRVMKEQDVAMVAGALTPTEVMAASQAGADFIKIFPCDSMGGAKYLKALRGPLPHVSLVPTGGVSVETAPEFLRAGAVALGVGSDLVDLKALAAGQESVIVERARALLDAVRRTRKELSAKAD